MAEGPDRDSDEYTHEYAVSTNAANKLLVGTCALLSVHIHVQVCCIWYVLTKKLCYKAKPLTATQSGRFQADTHTAALELNTQGLLNSRDLVQADVSHKLPALIFCYSTIRVILQLSGSLAGESLV